MEINFLIFLVPWFTWPILTFFYFSTTTSTSVVLFTYQYLPSINKKAISLPNSHEASFDQISQKHSDKRFYDLMCLRSWLTTWCDVLSYHDDAFISMNISSQNWLRLSGNFNRGTQLTTLSLTNEKWWMWYTQWSLKLCYNDQSHIWPVMA